MPFRTSPNLDDLLLDVATSIELSDRDRRVADNRYRGLKEHLERSASPLAPYLVKDESRIYPQGSMATGTTVVTGEDEDRFDLDAMVELNVPTEWSPKQGMDLLYDALKDFPDAIKVVRCTRCVQLQFAFMHMDVTLMDPEKFNRVERAGEIFHSPDQGEAKRVPANPFGFSKWFRDNVHISNEKFSEALNKRRAQNGIDRLSRVVDIRTAEQDDLPSILPPRLDAEQVVALKLLKRYLYERYKNRTLKRPPSIYIAKLAVDVGFSPYGVCSQLVLLALHIKTEMEKCIADSSKPDERNPSYFHDRLNDRWPVDLKDMQTLANDMADLITAVEKAQDSDFAEISKIFSKLFGEKISKHSVEALLARAVTASGQQSQYEKGTGAGVPTRAMAAPAVVRTLAAEPRHNFHCEVIKDKK